MFSDYYINYEYLLDGGSSYMLKRVIFLIKRFLGYKRINFDGLNTDTYEFLIIKR